MAKVCQTGGEAEDGHHFGRHGDVEPDPAPERPVVHVEAPAPGDLAGVEPHRIAPMDRVVDQGREQVVGRGDGVEVAVEVQVDLVHRHDLGVAAAGRAALGAETGSEARLPQGQGGPLAEPVESVRQAEGGGGLALAGGGRIDGGDQDQPSVRAAGPGVGIDLGHGAAMGFDLGLAQPELAGDLHDRPHLGGVRDIPIAHRGSDSLEPGIPYPPSGLKRG